jgi:hypothetical protein
VTKIEGAVIVSIVKYMHVYMDKYTSVVIRAYNVFSGTHYATLNININIADVPYYRASIYSTDEINIYIFKMYPCTHPSWPACAVDCLCFPKTAHIV